MLRARVHRAAVVGQKRASAERVTDDLLQDEFPCSSDFFK